MDEYISRDEAIKALYEVYEHEYPTASGDFDEYASHDVRNVLNGLPTADVQPVKHGEWEYEHTIGGMKHYHCTNCKCIADENQILWWKFCPNCGCKLDLEGNSND